MGNYRSITVILLVLLAAVSCRTADTLTEDEILAFDKQGWFYSILFYDPYLDVGIPDLSVTVSVDGELLTLTTNSQGSAEFTSGFNPQFEVSVTGQGYFSISRKLVSLVEETPNRGKTISNTFVMFPEADYATFTLQGKATVQSDLTTVNREPASGAKFTVELSSGSGDVLFPIVTGADGSYKAKLPAYPYTSYRLFYDAFTTNQTIAANRLSGQPVFPSTLPSIMQIETSFDPTGGTSIIPLVRPVFATVSSSPTGLGAQVANLAINTNISSGGAITFVSINSSGFGYAASSGSLPITVTSLEGGSGAQVTASTDASGQLQSINLANGGSGYTPFNSNTNKFGTFGEGFLATLPNNTFLGVVTSTFTPGAIIINNIYYGTGSTRSKAVN